MDNFISYDSDDIIGINIAGNAHILKKSADIIKYVGDLTLEEIKAGRKVTVIFPYRRPVYFLGKYISDALKTSTGEIEMFSIDDFIDKCYESADIPSFLPLPKINPSKAAFFLFDLNKKEETNVLKNVEKLDSFMPWGYKLFDDFEELLIESADPSSCDELINEKINPDKDPDQNLLKHYFSDKFSKFSTMYKIFYKTLLEQGFSSRSSRYKFIAENPAAVLNILTGRVILAGFYNGITAAETIIIKNLLKNKPRDVRIASKIGAEISGFFKKIGLEVNDKYTYKYEYEEADFYFNKVNSIHNEIISLKETIKHSKDKLSSNDLIVLSKEDYLFPLIHNVLNSLNKDEYNISIGYSLKRTPLYALFNLISVLHSRKKEGRFYAKDFISLFLHPYVKNISGKLNGLPDFDFDPVQTRILFQSIESYIKKNKILFVSDKDMENIEPVAGASNGLKEYFKEMSQIFIYNFENIKNVKDFIEKILKIIDTVSRNSSAYKHPYGLKFIESALTEIMEFQGISFKLSDKEENAEIKNRAGKNGGIDKDLDISSYKFDGISGYFSLLKNILKRKNVPFKGTPLKGLQVLGPLEARMINFDRVFYLGANEGNVPNISKENTVLTEDVRKFLNLKSADDSARIQEYNFFNLISGAKEVHFFYNDSDSSEKSRFIEKIIWNIQKKSHNLKEPKEENSVFKINFIRKEPSVIEKSEEVKQYLCGIDYSASKLDVYLKCPSMFYYEYVLNLREIENVVEDIDAREIGRIMHNVLKEYFEKFLHKEYEINSLENEKTEIYKILDKNFKTGGSGIINLQKQQILLALNMFIKSRLKDLSGAEIMGVEYPFETFITFITKIKLTGRADLILKKNGENYIIDYKTGSMLSGPNKNFIPTAENREEWLKMIKSVQLPFYIVLYNYSNINGADYSNLTAKLWGLKTGGEYSIDLKKDGIFDSYAAFIKSLIAEIINLDYFDFVNKEPEIKICGYCPYSLLCGRKSP
ncbi:MAG: PD-(D/E)XK nuclease family protein [bacterium]